MIGQSLFYNRESLSFYSGNDERQTGGEAG